MKKHITFENVVGLISLIILPMIIFVLLTEVDELWKKAVFIVAILLMFFGKTLPFIRGVINDYSASRNR